MRFKKLTMAVAAAAFAFSGLASAANSSATLTADNEFWLYSGNASSSDLQLVGSGNSWPTAYSFNFNVNAGDYLYVMALDWGQPHSWQGMFTTPTGTIFSNAASWVGAATPITGTLVNAAVINSASWGPINSVLPYNSYPWGAVVNNPNANWIWTSGINSGDVNVLFRTTSPVAAVPEPETYAMMLAGLGLMGFMVRRKKTA
jgi:PEP-CTERM motif